MSGTRLLARRLSQLDETALTALLRRRPDVLLGAQPRDLPELARRLREPHSLIAAMQDWTLPELQLAEAAQALGDGCTRARLAGFLDERPDAGRDHRAAVDRVVDDLVAEAVLVDTGDRLDLPEAFGQLFPSPLGLGSPLRVLLGAQPVEALRRIERTLGLPKHPNRADTLEALLTHLADPTTVRALLAAAPPAVSRVLVAAATDRDPPDDSVFDRDRYLERREVIQWAAQRGLVLDGPFGFAAHPAAEVGLALRGPDYRAPFTPRRPGTGMRPVDAERVERDSAAAATQFADHAVAVLDHLARVPVPQVKSGGIGARELARLARATAVGETEVRLALELADLTGLLSRVEQAVGAAGTVGVSAEFRRWRALDPADRVVPLLWAWWVLGWTPTAERDADGRPLRVLDRPPDCAGCRAGRIVVLETLAEIGGSTDLPQLARAARWRRPLAHLPAQDEDAPFATMWRESQTVGVLAAGAVSELGRILMVDDPAALRAHAAALLPPSADQARFGGDLTVYVVGSPSARVSALLDSTADRESSGGATTWRFGPASIRRALDDGATGDGLTTALAGIATSALPQPLTYLIGDVVRRHGHLRLSSATTCIRSDDEALLLEVAADRKLARLGVRLLAPTVLACDAPLPELLAALRAAGYLPVSEDRPGAVIELSARRGRTARDAAVTPMGPGPRRRPGPPAARSASPDPAAAARLLLGTTTALGIGTRRLSKPVPGPRDRPVAREQPEALLDFEVDRRTPTEHELSRQSPKLSTDEIRQLAHAIDASSRVEIEYLSSAGRVTRRVIDKPELDGGNLFAWCELRGDERIFSVGRIRSVTAVAS